MKAIVAVDKNWAIGCEGRLLTHLPPDLKYFKQMTLNRVVVMGRKTLESMPKGKPLVDRINIILTTDKNFVCEGTIVVNSIDELILVLKEYNRDDIFIIGGESVYTQMLDYCNEIYVTKIDKEFQADTYFPNLDTRLDWKLEDESEMLTHNDIKYKHTTYVRI